MPFVTNSAGDKNTSLPIEKELLGARVLAFNAEGGHTHIHSHKEEISKFIGQLEGGEVTADSTPHALPLMTNWILVYQLYQRSSWQKFGE